MAGSPETDVAGGTVPVSSIFNAVARLAREEGTQPHRLLPLAMLLGNAGRSHVHAFRPFPVSVVGNTNGCLSTSSCAVLSRAGSDDGHVPTPDSKPAVSDCNGNTCSPRTDQAAERAPAAALPQKDQRQLPEEVKEQHEAEAAEVEPLVCEYLRALNSLGSACTACSKLLVPAHRAVGRAEICLGEAALCLPAQVLMQAVSLPKVMCVSVSTDRSSS
jgi:hypothetical protein